MYFRLSVLYSQLLFGQTIALAKQKIIRKHLQKHLAYNSISKKSTTVFSSLSDMDDSFHDNEAQREQRGLIRAMSAIMGLQFILTILCLGLSIGAFAIMQDYFIIIAVSSEVATMLILFFPSTLTYVVSYIFYFVSLAMTFYIIVFSILYLLYPGDRSSTHTYIYLGLGAGYGILSAIRLAFNRGINQVLRRARNVIFPNQPLPGEEAAFVRAIRSRDQDKYEVILVDENYFAQIVGSNHIGEQTDINIQKYLEVMRDSRF